MSENFFLGVLAVITIAAVSLVAFSPPAKAQSITNGDRAMYDLNSDGCITREEVDAVLAFLAPDVTTLLDEESVVVFTSPNQTTDMQMELEDGCVVRSQLLPKESTPSNSA